MSSKKTKNDVMACTAASVSMVWSGDCDLTDDGILNHYQNSVGGRLLSLNQFSHSKLIELITKPGASLMTKYDIDKLVKSANSHFDLEVIKRSYGLTNWFDDVRRLTDAGLFELVYDNLFNIDDDCRGGNLDSVCSFCTGWYHFVVVGILESGRRGIDLTDIVINGLRYDKFKHYNDNMTKAVSQLDKPTKNPLAKNSKAKFDNGDRFDDVICRMIFKHDDVVSGIAKSLVSAIVNNGFIIDNDDFNDTHKTRNGVGLTVSCNSHNTANDLTDYYLKSFKNDYSEFIEVLRYQYYLNDIGFAGLSMTLSKIFDCVDIISTTTKKNDSRRRFIDAIDSQPLEFAWALLLTSSKDDLVNANNVLACELPNVWYRKYQKFISDYLVDRPLIDNMPLSKQVNIIQAWLIDIYEYCIDEYQTHDVSDCHGRGPSECDNEECLEVYQFANSQLDKPTKNPSTQKISGRFDKGDRFDDMIACSAVAASVWHDAIDIEAVRYAVDNFRTIWLPFNDYLANVGWLSHGIVNRLEAFTEYYHELISDDGDGRGVGM